MPESGHAGRRQRRSQLSALCLANADTQGALTVDGTGEYHIAPADRAPDQGYGAPWTVGAIC